MPELVKTDSTAKAPTLDDVMAAIGGLAKGVEVLGVRVDAMEKKDSEESEDEKKKKADEEKMKADAEDAEKKKADEFEKKAKTDAEEDEKKKKADAEKDGKPEDVAADAMKKADEACARADAAKAENAELLKRMDDMAKRLPVERADDDHRTMSASQARADSVYELFGKQAPRFMNGENNRQYRNRLVREFQEHSASWKPVDLATLADSAFAVAEEQVYADAAVAAKNSAGLDDGGLRMVPGTTPSGHRENRFYGRTGALIGRFSGSRRYATKINPNPNKSEVA